MESLDLIFKGDSNKVSKNVYSFFSRKSKNINIYDVKKDLILKTQLNEAFYSYVQLEYAHITIPDSKFNVFKHEMNSAYIDIVKDGDFIELLIFFKFSYMGLKFITKNFEMLNLWCKWFSNEFGFSTYSCRPNGGNNHEFYFNEKGIGSFYAELKNSSH